ncbi:MAG TPA: xylose isomerase [Ramlibacter sp.]|nr:xylose isomerase [Ramlibacter sp.]
MDRLLLGCNGRSAQHAPGSPPSIDEQFRMVKAAGVFDFFDRMPQPGEEELYLRASEKHGLPILTGLWSYTAGRDEALLRHNLALTRRSGGQCHNIMLFRQHADGHEVGDEEVVAFYRLAYEESQRLGIDITFEVHIYMWSEDFRRVLPVAERVRREGMPFNFLLDHSHVLLKLENPQEQDLCGIREDVQAGRLRLDPFEDGNILDEWIAQDFTLWHSVRPVAPNGPPNAWASHPDGRRGRACQYPFLRPRPGEWHSEWYAYKLEPSKEVVRRVLRAHLANPSSRLRYITTELIDLPDYGAGARYSLFEHSLALAQWIRDTEAQLRHQQQPGALHP